MESTKPQQVSRKQELVSRLTVLHSRVIQFTEKLTTDLEGIQSLVDKSSSDDDLNDMHYHMLSTGIDYLEKKLSGIK